MCVCVCVIPNTFGHMLRVTIFFDLNIVFLEFDCNLKKRKKKV